MRADRPGADLVRDYDISVYATATKSRHLSDRAAKETRAEQAVIDEQSVREIIEIRQNASGEQWLYPMGRHIGPAVGGLLVAAIFAAAGWYLVIEEDHSIFGGVFGAIGILVGAFCLYLVLNSLEVSKEGGNIQTVRKLSGIPISRKKLPQQSFERFEKESTMKSQSGGKHIIYYSIRAIDREGNEIVVGEGFKGENEAKAAMQLIGRELGLGETLE